MKFPSLAMGGEESSSKGDDSARSYAKEAFAALKDGDEEGFVTAFLGAVRVSKKSQEPDADDEG